MYYIPFQSHVLSQNEPDKSRQTEINDAEKDGDNQGDYNDDRCGSHGHFEGRPRDFPEFSPHFPETVLSCRKVFYFTINPAKFGRQEDFEPQHPDLESRAYPLEYGLS